MLVGVHELTDTGALACDDIVGEDDREGLVADQFLGHQDRVAQAQLLLLAHVADLRHVADLADATQHLDVTLRLQQRLQLEAVVEVVLDGSLLAARHDDDLLDASGDRLFDRVLDDRLVDQRQHLLGLCLGGRQEPGAPPCGRKHCLPNAHRASPCGCRANARALSGRRGCLRRDCPAVYSGCAGRLVVCGHWTAQRSQPGGGC